MELRPFQKKFLKNAVRSDVNIAALSMPRGNGKSWLAGYILSKCLTPGDELNVPGYEYILGAQGLKAARITFDFVREILEPKGGYSFVNSDQRISITHKPSNTRLRVISSNGKGAMGLGARNPLCVLDEPGSFEVAGGQLLWDAIRTAQGKPGNNMKIVCIGTLGPAMSGWWHDLVQTGSVGSRYVMFYRGDLETWDQWQTLRKANPLRAVFPDSRKSLLEERDFARRNPREKAGFLTYGLNIPSKDEGKVLLTIAEYDVWEKRDVAPREGLPIVGVDLGSGRAWSAAVALWQTGRVEAIALAPGIPDIDSQERRDLVPRGTYQDLVDAGLLRIAEGRHSQPPEMLWEMILEEWGYPDHLVSDRHRQSEWMDAIGSQVPIVFRKGMWFDQVYDIGALRELAKDGPLSIAPESREIISKSLMASVVKNDDKGNVRMIKDSTNNTARDDVAYALMLGAGAWKRAHQAPQASSAIYVPSW